MNADSAKRYMRGENGRSVVLGRQLMMSAWECQPYGWRKPDKSFQHIGVHRRPTAVSSLKCLNQS